MKKVFICLTFTFFLSANIEAKTLDQKKDELKKIYEAGGISKIEYEKSIEFLTKSKEETKTKKQKQSLSLSKKKSNSKKKNKDKDKNKEEITLEKIQELGEIIKFDNTFFTEGMIKKFLGCNNSFKCKGKKAGAYMWGNFGKSSTWGQKYPGKMIKSMAMYEVFYASRLYESRKAIERYKSNTYEKKKSGILKKIKINKKLFNKKKKDEETLRSLIGMNKGRINMREALGMDMDTPPKEAIQKFWLLGEFLELGIPTKNEIKVNKDILDRQGKLDIYKATISNLKKKLEERAEEKKSTKDKS